MKSVTAVLWMFRGLAQICRLYFYLFDQFILYPVMRKIAKKYQIDFLNLGYMPLNEDEEWINLKGGIGEEEDLVESLAQKAHYNLYEKALSLCPLYPKFKDKELIDVGCGIGGGLRGIRNQHPEIKKLVGIDQCIHENSDLDIIQANALRIPFTRATFDIVTNIESSHLYSNKKRFFFEAHRVLKPNGYLCWADLRPASEANKPFKYAKMMGFKLVKKEIINEQVLNGIKFTSLHYDHKLAKTPWPIRFFSSTFRTTYCAPGTPTYERLQHKETIYMVACWKKEINYK